MKKLDMIFWQNNQKNEFNRSCLITKITDILNDANGADCKACCTEAQDELKWFWQKSLKILMIKGDLQKLGNKLINNKKCKKIFWI